MTKNPCPSPTHTLLISGTDGKYAKLMSSQYKRLCVYVYVYVYVYVRAFVCARVCVCVQTVHTVLLVQVNCAWIRVVIKPTVCALLLISQLYIA